MNLKNLIRLFGDKGCTKLYVKELQRNNNSKQQIYIATGDTQILSLFPTEEFKINTDGKRKNATLHAAVKFSWLDEEGNAYPAPQAKFIFYPDYPEVRFSGFVRGSKKAPSEILNNQIPGRLLFFGVSTNDEVFGHVVSPESEIAQEFASLKNLERIGIIYSLGIAKEKIVKDTKQLLLKELQRIHFEGWIKSKQLGKDNIVRPCNTDRCGGPTLEAELGVIQNGRSEPDYLGWEIKQFGVKDFNKIRGVKITLMTPEPDGGYYKEEGVPAFITEYGYKSNSKADRMDFTGQLRVGIPQEKKRLKLIIEGYDFKSKKIVDASQGVLLKDKEGNIAASWSFSTLLDKFKKYNRASYIPSLKLMEPERQYCYSNRIQLGIGTDFSYFVNALNNGRIYYDPAIHIENFTSKPNQKTRNQFRILSHFLPELYPNTNMENVDLLEI